MAHALTQIRETERTNLLNTSEAAQRLGVSKRTIQELISERKLAFIKFGRNTRFDPADLAIFADSHRVKSVGWKGCGR